MIRFILIFLLFTTLAFGQKVVYYNYGYEGIERFGNWKDSTLIYSNHKARPTIRLEVCDSIVKRYIYKKQLPSKLVLKIKKATVYGKLVKTKKHKLIHLEFYYEKVVWNDSITEIYVPKVVPKNKK
jgi:hypothetical protein